MNKNAAQVIRVENLSKTYGKIKAVNDISFEVRKGEIFGFLGPNGAGKTTTLSILEGLLKPDCGKIYMLGMEICSDAKKIKRRIGVQLQSTSLMPDLTVFEQAQLFARLYGYEMSSKEIIHLLQQVGLSKKLKALPENLSGGQKQRLSLAIALINQPDIIFLDEPTTGLDPQSRRAMWDMIRELRNHGKTIVLTTHYIEEAEIICDRVGIIDCGHLVALDTPGVLINRLAGVSSITTSAALPLSEVQSYPHVLSVQQDGTRLHLQTNDVAVTLRAVLNLAERQGIHLNDLRLKQPGLEDVFLNITGHPIRT